MDQPHRIPAVPFLGRGQAAKCRAILDAATDVFCSDGVASASIDAIAAKAGVSRQTVYNQMGDKETLFAAVVQDIGARSSARLLQVLSTFPDHPKDIEADLLDFAVQLTGSCMCDPDGAALRKLLESEGRRYPELFQAWRDYGPGQNFPAISARFARLAHEGYLDIDDPNLAARQFMALLTVDLPQDSCRAKPPTEADVRAAAANAVRTFLRAFAPRKNVPA